MPTEGLEREVVDRGVYRSAVAHLKAARVRLPTFAELAEPSRIPRSVRERLAAIDPDAPDPLNLFRVHWHNPLSEGAWAKLPATFEAPPELTGVPARIVLLLGDTFPMIAAHKVLAAYAVLAPRLATGTFDPARQRAVWPSTGNYCRGGVAISRALGLRGVAVLPEGMSRERFEWLERWVGDPEDIVRTPGTESNVKEIYDRCRELERDPENVILNQFREFGNHLAHRLATAAAAGRVFEALREHDERLELRAWVAASGSAGTLGAGDALKERYGAAIVAAEALECPTLTTGGFGEHNIQGIGDKHVPLIHNAMATDFVSAISDRATDGLFHLFSTAVGRDYLASRRGVPRVALDSLCRLGLSSICNLLSAIRLARYLDLGEHDLVLTVATDGAGLYGSEFDKIADRDHRRGFDEVGAAETYGRYLLGGGTDGLSELDRRDRERIFNLGYYTWVEQQGVPVEMFASRREPAFWRGLGELPPIWDELIERVNAETGQGAE